MVSRIRFLVQIHFLISHSISINISHSTNPSTAPHPPATRQEPETSVPSISESSLATALPPHHPSPNSAPGSSSHPIDIDGFELAPIAPAVQSHNSPFFGLQPRVPSRPKPKTQTCTGFPFWAEDGPDRGLAHYPWAMHDANMLRWDPEVRGLQIYLRAHTCLKVVKIANPGDPPVCSNCSGLQYTDRYRNIVNRITNGCHESTKFVFMTMAQLVEGNRRRIRQYNSGRLSSLNAGRKLVVHAKEMDSYKRVLAVIATGKVNRVHAILTVARRNGSGVHGILDILNQAHNGMYQVKSFAEADFHKAELALRLGGGRMCEVLHNAEGLPAPRTVRAHSTYTQLVPSPSYPTATEIIANIDRSFTKPLKHTDSSGPVGAVMMIDELALDKRIRWDPLSNKLLGICREHGAQNVSLELSSIDDMEAINASIKKGRCHLASEVRFGPGLHG